MTTGTLPYPDADQLVDHWPWQPGWGVGTRFYTWHLTLEDQPELRALIRAYQDHLCDVPTVDPVPEQWLHLTTQGVGYVDDVSMDDRDAIVSAVSTRLAEIPAPRQTFHRPVLHRSAIVIPPTDPEPVRAVRTAIRAGIADVWGADRIPERPDTWRPHVSLGYINAPSDPAMLRELLDQVDPDPVTTTMRSASLLLLGRDNRLYEWTSSMTVPIDHGVES